MNRIIRSRLSIIAVLFIVPMTFLGCADQACEVFCRVTSLLCYFQSDPPGNPIYIQQCYYGCLEGCLPGSLQGCIDNSDECAAMFELYQAAIDTCEAYPEECAEVLDSYAQSFDTDAEE